MLYRKETGNLIRTATQHGELTVRGVALLLSRYLNDGNVRILLERAGVYHPSVSLSTGGSIGDDSAITSQGYRVQFRGQEEPVTVPWEAKPEQLVEYATELLRRSPERDLRDYWDTMRQNLTAVADELAVRQGLWKELERAQEEAMQTKPEEDDATFEAFLRELNPSQ